MKRILVALAILTALLVPAAAFWQSRDSNYDVAVSGGGGGGAAVLVDAIGTAAGTAPGATTITYTNLTISAGLPNSALVVFLSNADNGAAMSAPTATWDSGGTNQAMTIVNSLLAGAGNNQTWIFGLLSPTAGNKSLVINWTGGAQVHVCAVSLKNVTQLSTSGAFVNANSATAGSPANPATLTTVSQTNDRVVTGWGTPTTGSFTGAFSGSQICLDNTGSNVNAAMSNDPGSASVAATATLASSIAFKGASIDVVNSGSTNDPVWNVGDNIGENLSNFSLTSADAAGTTYSGIRATAGISTSKKYYFEFVLTNLTTAPNAGCCSVALVQSSYVLSNNTVGTAGAIGYRDDGFWGTSFTPPPGATSPGAWGTLGTVVGVAVDGVNKRQWLTLNGTVWNAGGSANPATNVGGGDISGLTFPLFPAFSSSAFNYKVTIRFDPATFTLGTLGSGPLVGFSKWGT